MHLRDYLQTAPRGTASRVARELGVNPVMVWQWAAGRKPVPVERAAPLERATGGAVMRWHSRPIDWHHMWPELVGTKGAPSLQQEIGDVA